MPAAMVETAKAPGGTAAAAAPAAVAGSAAACATAVSPAAAVPATTAAPAAVPAVMAALVTAALPAAPPPHVPAASHRRTMSNSQHVLASHNLATNQEWSYVASFRIMHMSWEYVFVCATLGSPGLAAR